MNAEQENGPQREESERRARRGVVLTLVGIGLVAAAYVVTIMVMVAR